MDKPKSKHGERYVKVKAKLFTWTMTEDIIEYDTLYEQFIIPQGYQVDTRVIDWEYID